MPVATARFFRTQRRSMRRHRTKRSSPKSADQVGSCSVLSTCVPLVVCSAGVCLSTHFLSMHTHLSVVRCICVYILSVLRLCKVPVLSAENPELSGKPGIGQRVYALPPAWNSVFAISTFLYVLLCICLPVCLSSVSACICLCVCVCWYAFCLQMCMHARVYPTT